MHNIMFSFGRDINVEIQNVKNRTFTPYWGEGQSGHYNYPIIYRVPAIYRLQYLISVTVLEGGDSGYKKHFILLSVLVHACA